jgi:arginase
MFAVDPPDPGGLTPEELAIVLRMVNQSNRCIGMQVTIYDPTLDPEKRCADLITDLLVSALAYHWVLVRVPPKLPSTGSAGNLPHS